MGGRFYLGFLPWVIFDVVTRAGGLGVQWGALLALASAFGVAVLRRRTTSLEILAAMIFTPTAWLAAADVLPNDVAEYMRSWSMAILAVFALISAITRPFTVRHTRDLVPCATARSAEFRHTNVTLSAVWGTSFGLMAISHALGTLVSGPLSVTVFHWLLPMVLGIGGVAVSQRIWNSNIDETAFTPDLEAFAAPFGTAVLERPARGRLAARRHLTLVRGSSPKR